MNSPGRGSGPEDLVLDYDDSRRAARGGANLVLYGASCDHPSSGTVGVDRVRSCAGIPVTERP